LREKRGGTDGWGLVFERDGKKGGSSQLGRAGRKRKREKDFPSYFSTNF
jgi:hypothetical protein